MSDTEYLAGLLEADGGFGIFLKFYPDTQENPQHRAVLSVSMTDPEPVEFAANFWGSSARKERNGMTTAVCPSKNIAKVLHQIHPHLKSKRRKMEALLMIALRNTGNYANRALYKGVPSNIRDFREALFHAMKAVKHNAN
jgi:hypothetical protein